MGDGGEEVGEDQTSRASDHMRTLNFDLRGHGWVSSRGWLDAILTATRKTN